MGSVVIVAVPLETDVSMVEVLVPVMPVIRIVLVPVPIDSAVDVVKVVVPVPSVLV